MSSNLHFIGLSETWLNDMLPSNMFQLTNEYALIENGLMKGPLHQKKEEVLLYILRKIKIF